MPESDPTQPAPADPTATAPEAEATAPKTEVGSGVPWFKQRRNIIMMAVGGVVVIAAAIWFTPLRYPVLGVAFKGQVQVSVVDSKTNQALAGANISLDTISDHSDKTGQVTLKKVKLGKHQLKITKPGYDDYTATSTVDIGTTKIGPIKLVGRGIPLAFKVTDLNGNPLGGVAVTIADAENDTADDGTVTVNALPPATGGPADVKITKAGFTDVTKSVKVAADTPVTNVSLVPAGQVYFLSNRSGRIDLYSSNIDGTNQTVILPGTGKEDSQTGLLPNYGNNDLLAIVSSREGRRNTYGVAIQDLFLFNTKTKALTKIEPNYSFSDKRAWIGNILVYEYNGDGSGCDEIHAYNPGNGQVAKLFTKGGNNGCANLTASFKDSLLYSVHRSSDQSVNGLYTVSPSGASRSRLDSTPADNSVRQVKNTLLYEYYTGSQSPPYEIWKSVDLTSHKVTGLPQGPDNDNSRTYVDSPGGQHSSFIEQRDGKTELYVTAGDGSGETKLTSMGSVNQFVQWYGDDYIVFSSTKSDENALYVISVNGGTPKKIADFYQGNSKTYAGGGNANY